MIRIVALLLCFLCSLASAQTALKVKMFPGAQALPALSAASQGIFERHGLKVEILFTANSDEQRARSTGAPPTDAARRAGSRGRSSSWNAG